MTRVQLPKLYIDHVEILVAKEIPIGVDFGLVFYVIEAFEYVWAFELPVCHLVVIFAIGHVKHSVYHANRIEILKLRRRFQEFKSGVKLHHNFQDFFEIFQR